VPLDTDGLRAALAETHRRYTTRVNLREGWRGYLWQGRFASFPMDEAHVLVCARYVELNPVRARLARRARDWRWSCTRLRAHNQYMTIVAMTTAAMKFRASLSYRVAMRRQSLSRPNVRSMTLRRR